MLYIWSGHLVQPYQSFMPGMQVIPVDIQRKVCTTHSIRLPEYSLNFPVTINAMTLVAFALGNIVGESDMLFELI